MYIYKIRIKCILFKERKNKSGYNKTSKSTFHKKLPTSRKPPEQF